MIKIALVQQKASIDYEANVKRGLLAVEQAANQGANIITFSELAFNRFYPQVPATQELLSRAESVAGKTVNQFQTLAKKFGVVVVLNIFERDGENTYDTSPIINSNGELMGTTRMFHITDYKYFHEKGYYKPGEYDPKVYKTKFGNIGIAICYDRHYPEYMRALALNGAEIVIIPQAGAEGEWPDGLYEAEMRVTAFQNGYFTALCNRVGKEENLTFTGESFVCDPAGRVIARAGSQTEQILVAEINIEEVKFSHAHRLFLKDRRPERYSKWFEVQ